MSELGTRSRIRVAYGSVPKDGGTFTFYRNIRKELAALNVEIYCVSIGPDQALLWDEDFTDPNCVLLAPKVYSIKKQAQIFVEWCEKNEIDIVIGINSWAILSSILHLPKKIRAMARCANAFDHGYRITMAGKERLSRIVALTPRLERDLVNSYGADPDRIRLIPNGVPEIGTAVELHSHEVIEIGFLGRLEHGQKGVRYIPEIVREMDALGLNYRLRIVGKGVDREWMEQEMQAQIQDGRVQFLGSYNPVEVRRFLDSIDIQLFTSHFEGCPNALLEGMMASAIPVAYSIDGITDFLIEHGETGYILPMADHHGMAEQISSLVTDRERMLEMKQATRTRSLQRYTNARCAAAYRETFEEVMSDDEVVREPLSWKRFKPDPNFKSKRFGWMPVTWWNYLRINLRR